MTLSALRLPASALALVACFAACGGGGGAKKYDDVREGAAVIPRDLALDFLRAIPSRASSSIISGERNIPPCVFASKGASSNGEYKRLIGRRGAAEITAYGEWILHKIEEPSGHDFQPADIEKASSWNYYLRTPRNARTPMGTRDHCVLGPSSEPVTKTLQALAALGVNIAPEFAFILPKQ